MRSEEARNRAGSEWELVALSLRIFSRDSTSRREAKAKIDIVQPVEDQSSTDRRGTEASDGLS